MNKVCSKCNLEKDLSLFHKKKNGFLGTKAECKTCCAEWQKSHYRKPGIKERRIRRQSSDSYQLYIRKFRLRRKYGLSLEQYQQMLIAQNHKCAICSTTKPGGRSKKYFAVDHNHITNKVRQLLCSRCNTVLGHVQDNQNLLLKMIDYLKTHG